MKKLTIAFCLTLLILIVAQVFTPVQAQISVESRINRLESDLAGIRSQLNQSSGNRSSTGVNVPTPSAPSSSRRTAINSDPRFDRLATLVIELKERINTLEQKVDQLQRTGR